MAWMPVRLPNIFSSECAQQAEISGCLKMKHLQKLTKSLGGSLDKSIISAILPYCSGVLQNYRESAPTLSSKQQVNAALQNCKPTTWMEMEYE